MCICGLYSPGNTKKEQQETEVYHAALPLSSAVRTGLEPATPGVTGLYSNRLNYRTISFSDGSLRHEVYQSFEGFLSAAFMYMIIRNPSLSSHLPGALRLQSKCDRWYLSVF